MGTKIGILYSKSQARVRLVVVPDLDSELPLIPRPGEGYAEQALGDYQKRGAAAAVFDITGTPPLSDRCAQIDSSGIVLGVVHADPLIDTAAGTLVLSDIAIAGDVLTNGVYMRRFALVALNTGAVLQVVMADASDPPTAVGQVPIASTTLQVGEVIASIAANAQQQVAPQIGDVVNAEQVSPQ